MRDRYTAYPRPILWLVPGSEGGVEPLYLSKTPVENEQYEAFDPGFERSPLAPDDRAPALGLSWDDAAAYCAWYAEVSRKPMRLPTEAEWEHACRAGGTGRWFWCDDPAAADDYLWDRRNSPPDRVPDLAAKRANGFGLHAMLGGVWEWTGSLYRPDASGGGPGGGGDAEPAGDAPLTETRRILRGGSWRIDREEITCSLRRAEPPDVAIPDAGFRIAKSLRG